jgi:hypothetical protein
MILTMIGTKIMIGMFRTKDGFYGEGNEGGGWDG